jgi:hypothetical protein
MTSTLDQYRQAKNDYLKLRNQAKKELIIRFNQVANELFQLQRELLEDFGEKIAIPSKAKKFRAAKQAKSGPSKPTPRPVAAPSPQVISLQRQLEKAKKKLSDVQAAGKPAKALEDRVYEIEDALRLAQAK